MIFCILIQKNLVILQKMCNFAPAFGKSDASDDVKQL